MTSSGEIDILSSPVFPVSSAEALTFEATIGKEIPRYFLTIQNVDKIPFSISNISFTNLPPGVSVTYDKTKANGFTFLEGKTLFPGDETPELFFEGNLGDPAFEGQVYSIGLNFRATSNGNVTDFSRVWFKLKPTSSGVSKFVIGFSIFAVVALFVLVIASLMVYFLVIRPRRLSSTKSGLKIKDNGTSSSSFLDSLDDETFFKLAMMMDRSE